MSTARTPEPRDVIQMIDDFIDAEHHDAIRWDNRSVLDESGVLGLHRLAAHIYAIGVQDGETAATVRFIAARARRAEVTP
jgi:hypothetical protein